MNIEVSQAEWLVSHIQEGCTWGGARVEDPQPWYIFWTRDMYVYHPEKHLRWQGDLAIGVVNGAYHPQ
jgi:hypothetical protein